MFFMDYLGLGSIVGQRLFMSIPNNVRLDLIQNQIETAEEDPAIRDMVKHFLAGFQILADWRNFLAHSQTILNDPEQPHLTFGKGSKRRAEVWSFAHLTIADLRKVADGIHAFWLFGGELRAFIFARRTAGKISFPNGRVFSPTLPERPPLPERLRSVAHGIPQEGPLQPESSQE
jgi:hypothetical protein